MHEPDGYPAANDAVLAAAAASEGRLRGARAHRAQRRRRARRGAPLPRGAARAASSCTRARTPSACRIRSSSRSSRWPTSAARPVLFHAGRGIPHLGEAVVDLARRYPGARLILAHAGISDLGLDRRRGGRAAQPVLRHRVVARRRPAAALRDDPARADPLRQRHALRARALRGARLPARARARSATAPRSLRSIAGGQLARVVAGEDPLDLGPAPGPRASGRACIEAERVVTYCAAALQIAFRGMDPTEPLALARLACRTLPRRRRRATLLRYIDALLAIAQESARRARPTCPSRSCPPRCWRWSLAGTPEAGAAARRCVTRVTRASSSGYGPNICSYRRVVSACRGGERGQRSAPDGAVATAIARRRADALAPAGG